MVKKDSPYKLALVDKATHIRLKVLAAQLEISMVSLFERVSMVTSDELKIIIFNPK